MTMFLLLILILIILLLCIPIKIRIKSKNMNAWGLILPGGENIAAQADVVNSGIHSLPADFGRTKNHVATTAIKKAI
jgi:hypothetical protein